MGSLLQHAGSFVAARRLFSSCGMQAPECTGSVVAVRGLSCPMARGILVPRPGIEPPSPALEGRFLTTGPPGKSLKFFRILINESWALVPHPPFLDIVKGITI